MPWRIRHDLPARRFPVVLCVLAGSLLLGRSPCFSQVQQAWVARYNSGFNIDEGRAIAVDNIGNAYVTGVGWGGSPSRRCYVTIKYGLGGTEVWVRQYYGPGNSNAMAVAVDQGGNVYVTGSSGNSTDDFDYVTIKYDPAGVEQWVHRYDSRPGWDDRPIAIAVDDAGNVFVAGTSDSTGSAGGDYLTVKYNASGAFAWAERYNAGGTSADNAQALAVDTQGNVYVTGSIFGPATAADCATVSYDSMGALRWEDRYVGTGAQFGYEVGTAVAVNAQGDVYVAGRSSANVLTIKYSSGGIRQWIQELGGSGSSSNSIVLDRAGNVLVAASTSDLATGGNFLTIKYSSSGIRLWAQQYGRDSAGLDAATAIAVDDDMSVYVTGTSAPAGASFSRDYTTVKYDSAGNGKWVQHYSGPGSNADGATDIAVDRRGTVYVTGVSGAAVGYECATVAYWQGMRIIEPRADDRWIAGESDTVRWAGGQPGDFLIIDYSLDGGRTYTQINPGSPADSNYYVWSIPDSLLSTRARVRLTDVLSSAVLAESDTFRLKSYMLTRIAPDGNYDRFFPTHDGWSFANTGANFWPASWWLQFQYAGGIDRHTGAPFDPIFPAAPVYALPHHFVDWPVYVDVFGRDACYWFSTDIYRESSVERWRFEKTTWTGSCFGIVQSALLYFHYREQFRQLHPTILPTDSLASIRTMTDAIRATVTRYFAMQYGRLKRDHDQSNQSTTPRQLLQQVRQMWANDNPDDDAGLRYRDPNPNNNAGHAVIPYRLERSTTNPVQFRLFVCNSNNPDSLNDFILIDSLANTWQEFTGFGWMQGAAGTSIIHLYPPAIGFFAPTTFSDRPASARSLEAESSREGRLKIRTPWRSDARIVSGSGDSIGVSSGGPFNTIGGAHVLSLETGRPQPPLGYDVPAGSYRIDVTNPVDSTIAVSFVTDSLFVTYARSGAHGAQRDELRYDGKLSMRNPDATPKEVNLQVLAFGESSDWGARISDLVIAENDSAGVWMDADGRPVLTNHGSTKTYRLGLRTSSANGLQRFESPTLTVPARSSHIIAPRWDSLSTVPLRIYVDVGSDGTNDDSLDIGNVVAADEERGSLVLPLEYNLAQNYPNPFNPSTTIRYGLPERSHVTLSVFNTLGQQVAVLQNGEQEAGFHEVRFDASGFSSGVYLYRLTAGSFVETRKLVLVR